MKTLKKLFSVSAIVALLGTLVPMYAFGADYTEELEDAYKYAYAHKVTTQKTIDSADMYGNLTRVAMAKMIANYATTVLGLEADTSRNCTFTDVTAALDAEYDNGVTNACQLGLMGIDDNGNVKATFDPKGVVTRAQFATALSRAISQAEDGEAIANGNPYYRTHIEYLNKKGIVKSEAEYDVNNVEKRGYVMLMMMRADDSYTPSTTEGCTPEDVLACFGSADYDACIAACSGEDQGDEEEQEVKAGTLTVSLGKALDDGTQIPQAGTIKLASVKFAASESIDVKTVSLKKVGLSAIPAGTKVWFEKDGVRISGKATFTSDGETTVSFAPALTVKSNETVDLYAEITAGVVGATIQMQSTDVESTAEKVNGSFKTPSLTFANYTVSAVTFKAGGAGGAALSTDNGIELGDFTLSNVNPSRDVLLQSITLKQIAAADLENLSDFVLERNGEVVSNKYTVDGKNVTFKVNDKISKDTSSVKYTIKAIANNVDTASDAYQFYLNKTTDLNIVEEETEFRATIVVTTVDADTDGYNDDQEFGIYTIAGGEMTFARDTSIELSTTKPAGSEVTMLKGTIKTNEAVSVEDVTLKWNGTNDLDTVFSTVYLKIGNALLSYTPATGITYGTDIKFEGSTTIDGTAQVKLYGTLRNTAAGNVKFAPLQLSSFTTVEYVSNGVAVNSAVGNIAANSIDVANTTLNVTRTDGLGDTTISAGSTDVTLYEVKLSATQGNGVKVSKAEFAITTGVSDKFENNTTLTLYVDGVAKSSKTFKTSPVSFDGFNVTVDADTPHTLKVVADFTENVEENGQIKVTLNDLTATDALTSNNIGGYAKPAGAQFTVKTASIDVAETTSNPKATLMLAGSQDNKLFAFKVTANNDNVRLYTVPFTGTNLSKATNYRLVNNSGEVIATATSETDTAVTFTAITNAPEILKDKSEVYYVVANTNTNVDNVDITLGLAKSGTIVVKASNGTTVNKILASAIAGNTHKVVENMASIEKLANNNKSLTTSAMRFAITAEGKNNVEVTGFSFTIAHNYTMFSGSRLVVYKDSVSTSNIVRTWNVVDNGNCSTGTSITSQSACEALTGGVWTANIEFESTATGIPHTIDAGETQNYIVALENVVASSSTPDWTLSLTDVTFDGINMATYTNLGELPISESK